MFHTSSITVVRATNTTAAVVTFVLTRNVNTNSAIMNNDWNTNGNTNVNTKSAIMFVNNNGDTNENTNSAIMFVNNDGNTNENTNGDTMKPPQAIELGKETRIGMLLQTRGGAARGLTPK